jgi:hypothetical protein
MGIAYRVDEPKGISISVWAGEITTEQATLHIATLAREPDWGAGGRILTDLTAVASSSLPNREQVSELARDFDEHLAGRARPAKWAVVANLSFNRASQFGEEISDEGRRLIPFFDVASACIWLGVDLDKIRPVLEKLRHEALSPAAED